ncbi:MAG: 30S ribosomal protein S6 [Saprospiraceae bacterium]
MRQYEVTFIVDPVLSSDEVKATVEVYKNLLKDGGCTIVNIEEMGLRQLAYPLNGRNTGVYFCIEFQLANGDIINPLELAFRRDERIIRFLTVKLDKYGVKYNEDKRNGLIGKVKKKEEKPKDDRRGRRSGPRKDAPKKDTPKKDEPKAEATPAKEETPKKED